MTLLCALDDFVQRTLAYVPGQWAKLLYLAALRDGSGKYCHWGLTRKYGECATQRALEEAHRAVLGELLRAPLPELLADVMQCAAAEEKPLGDFVQELSRRTGALLPGHVAASSARHFNSVLEALASLAQARTDANRRVS